MQKAHCVKITCLALGDSFAVHILYLITLIGQYSRQTKFAFKIIDIYIVVKFDNNSRNFVTIYRAAAPYGSWFSMLWFYSGTSQVTHGQFSG